MFKVAVNVAVDAELIPRNRFTKVVINDEEREEPKVLNIQQLNRLLEIAELAFYFRGFLRRRTEV